MFTALFLSFCHVRCSQDMPLELQLDVGCQLIQGVLHLHTQLGLAHLDLKPSNILIYLAQNGQPVAKIADFGLAEFLRSDGTVALQEWM